MSALESCSRLTSAERGTPFGLVEVDDGGREDVGQRKQTLALRFIQRCVERYGGQCFSALHHARLMIFGDVDAFAAEQRADATDDTGDVLIAKHEECAARRDVNRESVDAGEPARATTERDAIHRHLVRASANR